MNQDRLRPQEDLLRYFEQVSDKSVRTPEDLEKYLACVQEVRPQWLHVNRVARGWPLVQQIVLVLLFGFALVQYLVMDVLVEIVSLREVIYFVPTSRTDTRAAAHKPELVLTAASEIDGPAGSPPREK